MATSPFDHPGLTIALAMAMGMIAQAVGHHLRVPGIVLLLAVGVFFGPDSENVARLVVGLAARGNEHMDVMSALARVLENPKVVAHLATTKNPADVLRILDLG